ncbi:MAG: YidC/Oxa1 family membrane protein insertase [Lachnospiraceae bacterium]|jgi:YidC/Oxa1 family membrane protein insertase|nr:YidC/Oxa1 family membrane protein insertase [Lachnospiraceae bacterium]
MILLTKDSGAFIGPIANILGMLMNAIFSFWDRVGIPNTGLTIITFTIIIYICMLPLTIKQQKFSKLSAKMNPELQVIRDKYKGKKDQASMQAMNTETRAVYSRYGVSQMGSCVQLLIQMPILFALFRVINNMPAYVSKIKEAFYPLIDMLIAKEGSKLFLQENEAFDSARRLFGRNLQSVDFIEGTADSPIVQNTFIDIIYRSSSSGLNAVAEQYSDLTAEVANTIAALERYNNFFGINIGNAPSTMVVQSWNGGSDVAWLALLGAFAIPLLSAVTQRINIKLMPQNMAGQNPDQPNQMANMMKSMNTMMPLMSAFFCFTLPAGMGLYWVIGAVVRSIQQVIINRHFDKLDLEELIKQNLEKNKKKMEKKGIDPNKLSTNANINTRNVGGVNKWLTEKANQVSEMEAQSKAARSGGASADSNALIAKYAKTGSTGNETTDDGAAASSSVTSTAKAGGIAAKANMVRDYNERNRRDSK